MFGIFQELTLIATANKPAVHTIRYCEHNRTLHIPIKWRQMNSGIQITPQHCYEAMLDRISRDKNSVYSFHFYLEMHNNYVPATIK
jgi:NMD protein affecting ribosome stability and mRNA decay